jgi:hypothetical protein
MDYSPHSIDDILLSQPLIIPSIKRNGGSTFFIANDSSLEEEKNCKGNKERKT